MPAISEDTLVVQVAAREIAQVPLQAGTVELAGVVLEEAVMRPSRRWNASVWKLPTFATSASSRARTAGSSSAPASAAAPVSITITAGAARPPLAG